MCVCVVTGIIVTSRATAILTMAFGVFTVIRFSGSIIYLVAMMLNKLCYCCCPKRYLVSNMTAVKRREWWRPKDEKRWLKLATKEAKNRKRGKVRTKPGEKTSSGVAKATITPVPASPKLKRHGSF
jgi:hypothetical protein